YPFILLKHPESALQIIRVLFKLKTNNFWLFYFLVWETTMIFLLTTTVVRATCGRSGD
ncbi:unnamed protein product, partial [Rotaria socialis]